TAFLLLKSCSSLPSASPKDKSRPLPEIPHHRPLRLPYRRRALRGGRREVGGLQIIGIEVDALVGFLRGADLALLGGIEHGVDDIAEVFEQHREGSGGGGCAAVAGRA